MSCSRTSSIPRTHGSFIQNVSSCSKIPQSSKSFQLFQLPQDIVNVVLGEFLGSLKCVGRLDSATCSKDSRPILMSSMRAIHNTEFNVAGRDCRDSDQECTSYARNALDWLLSRNFTISRLRVCPFTLRTWRPNASDESHRIVVQSLTISLNEFFEEVPVPHGDECVLSMWSKIRWTELMWDAPRTFYSGNGTSISRVFDDSSRPYLPIDGLSKLSVGKLVSLDRTPGFLLAGRLREMTVDLTKESCLNWLKVLAHNRDSLEFLELGLLRSTGTVDIKVVDEIDTDYLWPSLTSLVLRYKCDSNTISDRVISRFLQCTGNVRNIELYNNSLTLSDEVAVALLTFIIWRPRKHTTIVNVNVLRIDVLEVSPSWRSDDPPLTVWPAFDSLYCSDLWQHLPTSRQRFQTAHLTGYDRPRYISSEFMEYMCGIYIDSPCELLTCEWYTILSAPRIARIKVDVASRELESALQRLACEVESGSLTRKPACSNFALHSKQSRYEYTQPILYNLGVCYGHSLLRVVLSGMQMTSEGVVQLVVTCWKLKSLSVDMVAMTESEFVLQSASLVQHVLPKRRRTLRLEIGVGWPECNGQSWEELVQGAKGTMEVCKAAMRSLENQLCINDSRVQLTRDSAITLYRDMLKSEAPKDRRPRTSSSYSWTRRSLEE